MIEYIKKLLPRLKNFSQSLSQTELFVEKPWVLINNNGQRETFIFKRDKKLVLALNGEVQEGEWEYFAEANRLFVNRGSSKILLQHAFANKGLLLLKKEGTTDEFWILMNENEIPDLNAETYLKNCLIEKMQLKSFKLEGKTLYYSDGGQAISYNTRFFDETLQDENASYSFRSGNTSYHVENGSLKGIFNNLVLKTEKGELTIKTKNEFLEPGDKVFLNNIPADDGNYKVKEGKYKSITVKDGNILSFQSKHTAQIILVCFMITVIAAFVILYFESNKNNTTTVISDSDTSSKSPDTVMAVKNFPSQVSDTAFNVGKTDTSFKRNAANKQNTSSDMQDDGYDDLFNRLTLGENTRIYVFAVVDAEFKEVPHIVNDNLQSAEYRQTLVTNIVEKKNDADIEQRFKDEVRSNTKNELGFERIKSIKVKFYSDYNKASIAREAIQYDHEMTVY